MGERCPRCASGDRKLRCKPRPVGGGLCDHSWHDAVLPDLPDDDVNKDPRISMMGEPTEAERAFCDAGSFVVDEDDVTGELFWRGGGPGDKDETRFGPCQPLTLCPGHFGKGARVIAEQVEDAELMETPCAYLAARAGVEWPRETPQEWVKEHERLRKDSARLQGELEEARKRGDRWQNALLSLTPVDVATDGTPEHSARIVRAQVEKLRRERKEAKRLAFKQAAEVARGHDCHTLEGYRYACECHLTIAAVIEELSKREED